MSYSLSYSSFYEFNSSTPNSHHCINHLSRCSFTSHFLPIGSSWNCLESLCANLDWLPFMPGHSCLLEGALQLSPTSDLPFTTCYPFFFLGLRPSFTGAYPSGNSSATWWDLACLKNLFILPSNKIHNWPQYRTMRLISFSCSILKAFFSLSNFYGCFW